MLKGDGVIAVGAQDTKSTQPQNTKPLGHLNRRKQRLAFTGAIGGLLLVAVGRVDLLQDNIAWIPSVGAIFLASWLPLVQAVTWLTTGEVQAGAISVVLAAGAAALGRLDDAALLLCVWTLTAVLRARVYELAAKPLERWDLLAQGIWPLGRSKQSKKSMQKVSAAATVADLAVGDENTPLADQCMVVGSREVIPCDGIIEKDAGLVSTLWDNLPAANKDIGSLVYAGDVNLGDPISIRPVRRGAESALAHLVRAGRLGLAPLNHRSQLGRILRIWSLWWSVAAVIVAIAVPFLMGFSTDEALMRGLSLLALALPGAWGAAEELPVIAAAGAALRRQYVPTSGWVMEHVGRMGMLALVWDVTFGRGKRYVADVLPVKAKACSPMELLALAAAVQVAAASEDPVAEAIKYSAEKEGLSIPNAIDGRSVYGEGASATVEGHPCLVGTERYMRDHGIDITTAERLVAQLQAIDCRPVLCAAGGYLLGAVGINEPERQEWPRISGQLHKLAIKLVVVNGNPEEGRSAWAPGHPEGMVNLLAGQEIRTLRSWSKGRGYMGVVGDAGRDKDILSQADIGMAMGPVAAVEGSGHLLLMHDSLTDLPWILQLGRRLRRCSSWVNTLGVVSRLVLAVLVVGIGLGAVQVVAIDMAIYAVVALAALRLLGSEKLPMPHMHHAVDRRRRSR